MEENRVHISKVEIIVLGVLIAILTLASAAVHSQYAVQPADAAFYGINISADHSDTGAGTHTPSVEEEVDQFFWGLPLFHH